MHWSYVLKLDYILTKYEKPQKNMQFLARLKHFCRSFNFRGILAQNAIKFIFLEVCCFFWHPPHPWIWLSSVLKKFRTFLAVCTSPFHYPEDHGGVKSKELSLLVGSKSKISEKLNQNWSCLGQKTISISLTLPIKPKQGRDMTTFFLVQLFGNFRFRDFKYQ